MKMHTSSSDLVRTARITGVWYLTLGISGILGFMVFHPQVFISEDPAKTLENLTERESFARVRLLLEFTIVVSQALAAVWFYRLFRDSSQWRAWAIGAWGMANSVAIMISAMAIGVVLGVAGSASTSLDDKMLTVQLMDQLSKNAWGVGGLFFGLWLIPMGNVVVISRRMPVWLGRLLIIGGVGYLANTFVNYGGYTDPLTGLLVLPATIGEFWMIGYLLTYGIRPADESWEKPAPSRRSSARVPMEEV